MDPQDPTGADSQTLSARTTPTWEMELLVSGATVFGLLQLPGPADRWLFGLYNGSTMELSALVLPLWMYVKFALYALIATFIGHLCIRGYWVALIGLYSVYPRGIRWENLGRRMGPHYLATSREVTGELPDLIERADNRASRVFGVGFGLATTLLVPIALVTIAIIALRIPGLVGQPQAVEWLAPTLLAVFSLLLLPFMAAWWYDRRHGADFSADSPRGRRLRRLFRFFAAIGFGRSNNTLISLFASNEGGRRTQGLIGVGVAVALVLLMVHGMADRIGLDLGEYRALPPNLAATADLVLPGHYRSERGDGASLVPLPYLPSPVSRGPYLPLFVPYLPSRHDGAMARSCGVSLDASGEAAARARLDCLAVLHDVRLDGVPLAIRFDAAEDPDTGQRGMLAMIPVRGLAEGRHELSLRPASARKRPRDEDRRYRIPFWR